MITSTEDGISFDYHFYLKYRSYRNLTQEEESFIERLEKELKDL